MPRVNSASVAGGSAPDPLDSISPEPQSPVEYVVLLEPPSKLQPVRPQKRPGQPAGARKVREVSLESSNPLVSSLGLPEWGKILGHTVKSHLLTSVNVVHLTVTPLGKEKQRKNQTRISRKSKILSENERNLDEENGEIVHHHGATRV